MGNTTPNKSILSKKKTEEIRSEVNKKYVTLSNFNNINDEVQQMFQLYKKLEPEDIPAFKKTVHQMYINASELKIFAERLAPMVELILPESTPKEITKVVTKVVTKVWIFCFHILSEYFLTGSFFPYYSLVKNVLRIQRGKKS